MKDFKQKHNYNYNFREKKMACAITRFIQYSIQSHHEIAFEEKVQLKKKQKKTKS